MPTTTDPRREVELPADSPVQAIVYLVVGIGLTVCLVALLYARGTFGFGTIALALLTTVPFLVYARLAIARPGAEAVVAGVLLLAVGCWGSVDAIDADETSVFIRLPLSLLLVELVVFAMGAALRRAVPPADPEA